MRTRVASQVGYPLLGVLLILVTWLLICWIGNLPTVVLPTPDKVLRAFIDRFDLLVSEAWFTLKETLGGFLLALLIGLPISWVISRASASALSSTSRPMCAIARPRIGAGMAAQDS